jgi:hypothetical protein
MAMEVHYTAEEAEQAFLRAGNELALVKCRLNHLIDVMYNRFGKSHRAYKHVWALYENIIYHLCGALDTTVCNYYPRGTGSIGGVYITHIFYRAEDTPSPFALTPAEGRRRTKQLLLDEKEYYLNTLHLTEGALTFILLNSALFGRPSQLLIIKLNQRIDYMVQEMGYFRDWLEKHWAENEDEE